MKAEVGIAELKGKLSEYLRAVRKGEEVVIKDRETPIARLVPFEKSRPRLPFFRPKGLRPGDLEEALREERKDRFGRFSTSPDFSSVARS